MVAVAPPKFAAIYTIFRLLANLKKGPQEINNGKSITTTMMMVILIIARC